MRTIQKGKRKKIQETRERKVKAKKGKKKAKDKTAGSKGTEDSSQGRGRSRGRGREALQDNKPGKKSHRQKTKSCIGARSDSERNRTCNLSEQKPPLYHLYYYINFLPNVTTISFVFQFGTNLVALFLAHQTIFPKKKIPTRVPLVSPSIKYMFQNL